MFGKNYSAWFTVIETEKRACKQYTKMLDELLAFSMLRDFSYFQMHDWRESYFELVYDNMKVDGEESLVVTAKDYIDFCKERDRMV